MNFFSKQIYSYNFHICKLNNLKVIDDLYSQYLTQILFKTIFFTNTEGVCVWITGCELQMDYFLRGKRRHGLSCTSIFQDIKADLCPAGDQMHKNIKGKGIVSNLYVASVLQMMFSYLKIGI